MHGRTVFAKMWENVGRVGEARVHDASLRASWAEVISLGVIGSCQPQRVEFRRSARTLDEYEQMSEMFDALYPNCCSPQGRLAMDRVGTIPPAAAWRPSGIVSLGSADLRHAEHHDLVVLHDDSDFATAARYLPDLRERTVQDAPPATD